MTDADYDRDRIHFEREIASLEDARAKVLERYKVVAVVSGQGLVAIVLVAIVVSSLTFDLLGHLDYFVSPVDLVDFVDLLFGCS